MTFSREPHPAPARGDLPAHLGLDLDRFKRCARSDLIQVERNILLDHLGYIHRPRWRRRCRFLPPDNRSEKQEKDDEGDDSSNRVNPLAPEAVFEMDDCFSRRDVDPGHGCHCI